MASDLTNVRKVSNCHGNVKEEISPPPLTKMVRSAMPKYERISVEAVKTLAETQNIVPIDLTANAWQLLSEDLNFRLREIALLAAKFAQRHGRGARLATKDINNALQQLGHETIIGYKSTEPPKVHPLKMERDDNKDVKTKIYAMNEGCVELRALAKSRKFDHNYARISDNLSIELVDANVISLIDQSAITKLTQARDNHSDLCEAVIELISMPYDERNSKHIYEAISDLASDSNIVATREILEYCAEALCNVKHYSIIQNVFTTIKSIVYSCSLQLLTLLEIPLLNITDSLFDLLLDDESLFYGKCYGVEAVDLAAAVVYELNRRTHLCSIEIIYPKLMRMLVQWKRKVDFRVSTVALNIIIRLSHKLPLFKSDELRQIFNLHLATHPDLFDETMRPLPLEPLLPIEEDYLIRSALLYKHAWLATIKHVVMKIRPVDLHMIFIHNIALQIFGRSAFHDQLPIVELGFKRGIPVSCVARMYNKPESNLLSHAQTPKLYRVIDQQRRNSDDRMRIKQARRVKRKPQDYFDIPKYFRQTQNGSGALKPHQRYKDVILIFFTTNATIHQPKRKFYTKESDAVVVARYHNYLKSRPYTLNRNRKLLRTPNRVVSGLVAQFDDLIL